MPIDLSKTYDKYRGQWVAFKDDEKTVISHGETAKAAYEKAMLKGFKSPILARMPSELLSYVGAHLLS